MLIDLASAPLAPIAPHAVNVNVNLGRLRATRLDHVNGHARILAGIAQPGDADD